MLTKKDRKILNQKSMIHNRDILIDSSLLGVDGTARLIETLAKQVEKQ